MTHFGTLIRTSFVVQRLMNVFVLILQVNFSYQDIMANSRMLMAYSHLTSLKLILKWW